MPLSDRCPRRPWVAYTLFLLLVCAISLVLPVPSSLAAERGADPELAKLGAEFLVDGWKPSWSGDGKRIVFGGVFDKAKGDVSGGLLVLDIATGERRRLTELGKDPAWSPGDGGTIAYVAGGYGKKEQIWVVDPDGGEPSMLVPEGGYPSWAPDGVTLYYQSRVRAKLMRVRTGAERPEPEEVMEMLWWYPVVSPDARHVAYRLGAEIQIADIETKEVVRRIPQPGGKGFLGGWCPKGRYLSYGGYGSHDVIGLWVVDVKNAGRVRVSGGSFTMSAWSPDGSKIAFDHRKRGGNEIWLLPTKALSLQSEDGAPPAVDRAQVRLWMRQLSDDDFKIREGATRSLISAGAQVLDELYSATRDASPEVRARAKRVADQIALDARFGG